MEIAIWTNLTDQQILPDFLGFLKSFVSMSDHNERLREKERTMSHGNPLFSLIDLRELELISMQESNLD